MDEPENAVLQEGRWPPNAVVHDYTRRRSEWSAVTTTLVVGAGGGGWGSGRTAGGSQSLFEVTSRLQIRHWWWRLDNPVNILKSTELYTLDEHILWYANLSQ